MESKEVVGKIIAIDHGDRRIGLAISDDLGMIAFPFKTIDTKKDRFYIDTICKIVDDGNISGIVVGWPIGMSGNITSQTNKVEDFINKLEEKTSAKIIRIDERLTSAIAKRKMIEAGKNQKDNKGEVDMLAAATILQDFLDNA